MEKMKPHYIYRPSKFADNYRRIEEAFGSCSSGGFKIAYSFKTNAFPAVISKAKELGSLAEVVSPFEYSIAREAGFSPDQIVYNGVCKDRSSFLECALGGGRVNLDNQEDLQFALDYFEQTGRSLSVGVRVSFDIGSKIPSHFGVDVESSLFRRILELDGEGKISVVGLHCHFTMARDLEFWKRRAEGMAKLVPLFKKLEYVDFGGNMYASCQKNLLSEYASVLKNFFAGFEERKLLLVLETGTPLVAESFDVVSHVTHIKEGFIFVDVCQKDVGLSATMDECKIKLVPAEEVAGEEDGSCNQPDAKSTSSKSTRKYLENYTVVGSTCLENDILKKSFCGKVRIGDKIVFQNCGAYSLCWSNNFILPVLPVITK